MNRIGSLDWQRGLLAFSIMAYHLTGWELRQLDASSLLGRLGIYGVSMFFVLSGLSIALVYNRYIQGLKSSLKFLVRRVFRIWPLLWLAIAFATGSAMLAGRPPYWWSILVNLTTAFGFVDPAAYMNVGAWSIGNEMVYYALTPLIILAYNRRRVAGNFVTLAATFVGAWFSSEVLTPDRLNTLVFGGFAFVALAIAVVGVAGVLAFSVSGRTREFGIRLAVGSQPRHLVRGVIAEGAAMAGIGIAAGAIGGFALARLAAGYFQDLKMPGPTPVIGSAMVLLAAAVIASMLPATRAARVDVMQALRSD